MAEYVYNLLKSVSMIFVTNFLSIFVLAQHEPHFQSNRNGIVHLFEWKFLDVAKECEEFLGPKGFGGVQLSPVNENLVCQEEYGRPWWERYQPMSYKIASRSGTEEEFLDMSKKCLNAGVRIYVDVVLNHMAAPRNSSNEDGMIGTGGSTGNAFEKDFPAVPYTSNEFHKDCVIKNYFDAHEVRNCQLNTLPDLDQSLSSVKGKITEFLNHLIDLGVAGFRIDAAKHMWPIDCRDIYSNIKNLNTDFGFPEASRPFIYQEVIDLGGEAISKTEYSGYGVVTEFLYSAEIGTVFNGRISLSSLINWGPAMGFLPHHDSLVFIDNHDNQRGHGAGGDLILTHKNPKKYIMAVTFMLAHPYGIKRLMSSFVFENTDQGPPSDSDDNIKSPVFDETSGQCNFDSGWVCEHRWNSIANMVEFTNLVNGESIINWQDNGPNQIAFCRGSKGFLAFNNDQTRDYDVNVYACLEPGNYCDIISGYLTKDGKECSGKKITLDAEGKANISIPFDAEFGVMAIHKNSKLL